MHTYIHYYRRILIYSTVLFLLLTGCQLGISQQHDSEKTSRDTHANNTLVHTKEHFLALQEEGRNSPRSSAAVRTGYSIVKTAESFDPAAFEKLHGTVESVLNLSDGYQYFLVHTHCDAHEFRTAVRKSSGVVYAQPDHQYTLPAVTADTALQPENPFQQPHRASHHSVMPFGTHEGNVLEDPKAYMFDWGLTVTQALEAFQQYDSKATHPVLTAIIDTGVNSLHEDFYDSNGKSIIFYAKSTLQRGKAVDLPHPAVIPVNENWDNVGHGTHCAGTIAAVGNNGKGICGVSHANTRLITYRGIDAVGASEFATYSCLGDLAQIITELRKEPQDRNASILSSLPDEVRNAPKLTQACIPVNMSLGGSFINLYEIEMTNKALAAGILPIVAMGNDGITTPAFPAANQGVLAVGATTMYDKRASFSNGGAWMSVCAPGKSIYSCNNGEDKWHHNYSPDLKTSYKWLSGTSMATPFVTGLATYLLAINPQLTAYQLKTIIEQTADKIDSGDSEYGKYDSRGHSKWYGYGRVNVLKAAKKTSEGAIPAPNSVYAEAPVIITVQKQGSPLTYTHVWVYEKSGGYTSAGITNRSGIIEFRGLRANTEYEVGVSYNGSYKSVTLDTGNMIAHTISFP